MLSPYRVLDLSDERGLFCSRLLADLGADVIHVEPPEGSPARSRGRHAGGGNDPERSLTWWAMARGFRSAALDLDDPADRESFLDLVRTAAVLVESHEPGTWEDRGLSYGELSVLNPRLVWVSITPFGSDGPKAHWAATDLVVQAASGAMAVTGDGDRGPLRAAAVPSWTHAGAEAAGGALIALREALHSGRGQRVEVSAQRATNLTAQFVAQSEEIGAEASPRRNGLTLHGVNIPFIWAAADGFVSLTVALDPANKSFLQRLLGFMGEEGYLSEDLEQRDWTAHLRLIRSGDRPPSDLEELRGAIAAFVASKTKDELFAAALDRKLLLVPVATFDDMLADPQLEFRHFWREEHLPDDTTALLPGHLTHSSIDQSTRRRPAPSIGEHTDDVLTEKHEQPELVGEPLEAPLAGVKVLDFMWAMAGPAATGVLAQYGATVLKVENEARMDAARLLPPFYDGKPGKENSLGYASINAAKLSITIDPNKEHGRDVILDLVRWADVVTESFSPRAMRSWGLDYESLREVKPDLIMLSSCLMGQQGPYASVAGYGTMGTAASGLVQPTGWPDRRPSGPFGAYTDYCAPRITVVALLAALDHRRRTGEGRYLDQSQIESTLNYIAPAVLDRQVNGTDWDRMGNADHEMSPHGVFACAGDDQWVAIACRDDADWVALCDAVGIAGAQDDIAARRARAAEIDDQISAWTAVRSAEEAQEELQAGHIPAHRVVDASSVNDPQLVHLEHTVDVPAAGHGDRRLERTRIQLTRTPPDPHHVATLGQHTDHVLREFLDYTDAHIAQLRATGALGSSRAKPAG